MRIVFMGTPDFAVGSLKQLLEAGHEIVGVFTQPDKPQGRKMVLTPPPVKKFALEKGLTVYQPASVKTGEALELLKSLDPELIAVVAYGKILPKEILELPKFGCVNAHASLLPRHRGASPIQWSIYCGDSKTGVTTMLMDEGMDTGDMLKKAEVEITDNDNFETLHDKLAEVGAELLVKTVEGLENGTVTPQKQPEEGVCYAPIIKKEMGQIDFSKTAREIDCLVRAFTPWPSAFMFVDGARVKVLKAKVTENCDFESGTVVDTADGLKIACGNGTTLTVLELQPEGKGAMTAKAYLNGKQLKAGTKL